jgi:hypothetical protein
MLVAAGACTLLSREVRADERIHARLTYRPDAELDRCPTQVELRDAVAARLGYDPFDGAEAEPREVIVLVRKKGNGVVGSLELRGPHPGQRELASPRGDCREVLDAFAVAIAIGLDPASLGGPVTEPPPERPPSTLPPSSPPGMSPPSSPPADRLEATPERDPYDVRLGGGPAVLFGELPEPAPAFVLGASVRWRWLEGAIEGFATLPVSRSAPAGKVTASILAAAVVPCVHVGVVFGCAGVALGALRGEGQGIETPHDGSHLFAAASVRGGAELAVTRSFWVRGHLDGVAPLTRIALQLAEQDVWRMPSLAARVGVTAGVRF